MNELVLHEHDILDMVEIYGNEALGLELESNAEILNSEEVARKIIECMTNIQSSIDRTAEMAAVIIKRKAQYLHYLSDKWTPFLKNIGITRLPVNAEGKPTKKNVRWLEGGLYFKKTGGATIEDSTELKHAIADYIPEPWHKTLDEINNLLSQYGASLDIKLDRTAILKKCTETGEVLPGVKFYPPDDFGQLKVGLQRGWTSRSALAKIKAAFSTNESEASDDGEE